MKKKIIKSKRVLYSTQGRKALIVAPHGGGPTDQRTAMISEIIANKLQEFAVINTGWIRPTNGQKLNTKEGFANLNNLKHCNKPRVKREFLEPIDKVKKFLLKHNEKANIFIIHGMDDTIKNYNGVDIVIGYGNGLPPRYTCTQGFRERMIAALIATGFNPAKGRTGGRLSAWSSNNLAQLYSDDLQVETLQIEIGLSLRYNDDIAKETAKRMAKAIEMVVKSNIVLKEFNVPKI